MATYNDPLTIIERIVAGNPTDADIDVIRQLLTPGNSKNVVQLGRYNVNIGNGQDIHIGDRIYQGADAEAIREILRSGVQENQQQSILQPLWRRRRFIALTSTVVVLAGAAIFGQNSQEKLAVTCVRQSLKNSPVIIINFAGALPIDKGAKSNINMTGLITTYWEVFLSNNSDKTLSVINYELLQIGTYFPATSYSGMNQGLYLLDTNGKILPVRFPIVINAGNTVNLIVRIGIQIDYYVYKLVQDKIQEEPKIDFRNIEKYLWSKGIDFYGNQVESIGYESYSFPPFEKAKEQVFKVYFRTARGTDISQKISLYGTIHDELLEKTC